MADKSESLSAEKQMLLALRALRQRVEDLEGRDREPIAIIGMSCRFPGGVNSPDDYWRLLLQKRDAIREIPRHRLDLDPLFDPRPQTPGKTYSRWAGLLDAPQDFDAEFFGISPREAVTLDPQQRLLLEISWEALENAGINPKAIAGQNAGVFVGITTSEYAQLLHRIVPHRQLAAHVLQGLALNAAAGRLSYFYGLNGPSMAVDTACSSSLVAIDRACRSLREGETPFVIAAGVNVIASPESLIIGSQWGMLSAGGKVRAFDGGADGFVRGEGCGVVVLKRLREAEAAGDRIQGVILGSAVNQDGASSGLTVPNGLAQQSLLREAHRRAGIEAKQVGYVEAHGTGTTLGDPIEAEALGVVFGERAQKLLIGSVKTNIGHLESAAGVAGLIKVVLGLQQGMIPGQLNWEKPSEHVRWSELPLEVVTQERAWEPIEGRRIGGVSSFGFSGTNAHVVVEGWREEVREEEEAGEEVLVVTARTEAALREQAERYAEFLVKSDSRWSEICYTAAVGRAVFGERLAVVAKGKADAGETLRGWLRGESVEGVYRGQVGVGRRAGTAMLGKDAAASTVAAQFVQGEGIDWAGRAEGRKLRRVALPTYAFQRERYWIEAVEGAEVESGEATGRGVLGRRIRAAGVRGQFEARLSGKSWIGEHVVGGRVVLPATGHLELMLEAGAEVFGSRYVLEDVVLQVPLVIEGERRVQTVVEEAGGGRSRVRVYGEQAGGGWERVSEGWLLPVQATEKMPERLNVEEIWGRLQAGEGGESFYAEMVARGLEFGDRFRGVEKAWGGAGEALGEIVSREAGGKGWELEPWWLDACLQVSALAGQGDEDGGLYLPLSVGRLQVYGRPGLRSWSHVAMRRIDAATFSADVTITDPNGSPLAHLSNLRFRKSNSTSARTAVYGVDWTEAPVLPKAIDLKGHWGVILSENDEFGEEVCRGLEKRGATWSLISSNNELGSDRDALRSVMAARGTLQGILDLRAAQARNLWALEGAEQQNLPVLNGCLVLLQALLLEQIHPVRGLWLVTGIGEATEGISPSTHGRVFQALRRTAVLEFPELAIHSLDIDTAADTAGIFGALGVVDADEMVVRGGRVFVPQLKERIAIAAEENIELVPAESGLIEDLKSIPVPRKAPQEHEVEIAVHAHGLNFRDVMNSLGMLPGMVQRLGGECAGVVIRAGKLSGFGIGERVLAFAPGAFRKFVTVKSSHVARVPEGLSMAQAAGLPVVYLTALYGFAKLARLQRGESVLIHSAAGGLGLAAIHLARMRGAEIYATAGSEEKRRYLRSLGIQHALPSRTAEFADEVMRLTYGRGVDVVLNSLTGALAEKTLSIVAKGGRFLEVGKRETLSGEAVAQIRPDVHHFVYDLGQEVEADDSVVPSLLQEILRSLASGAIAPLPVTDFIDPKEAFRYMAQARHIGKVIVTRSDTVVASGALKLDPDATYLITGGCGGLGLLFAEKLVERGARRLVLVGRSVPGAVAAEVIQRMRSGGAEITVMQADVSDRSAVESALHEIPSSSPLRGILHVAGVLDDHSLLEQSPASLFAAMQPKWQGAWNLHTLTRHEQLDFFVLFSSAAALLGSPGQANYAAANAMLDAFAMYRRKLGLPALSIQWGPWNAPGMTERLRVEPQGMGLGRIDPDDGVKALETLLRSNETVAAVLPILSWETYVSRQPKGMLALFRSVVDTSLPGTRKDPGVKQPVEPFSAVMNRASGADRRAMLQEHLQQQTLQILSLPSETRMDEDEALHDLGLDSLMAVELRNSLVTTLDRQLSPTILLDYPTLRTLTDFLLTEVFAGDEKEPVSNGVAAISDAEAEALLLEELGRREHGTRR